MGQVNGIADRMFRQSTVMDISMYDGVFNANTLQLGNQKYMRLKPGYAGKIEHSEMIGNNVILMISVRESDKQGSQVVRLSHDLQSLAEVPNDSIYVLMVENDTPIIPSIANIDKILASTGKKGTFVNLRGRTIRA